jgi:ribosome-binding protein aMBF1 (putative translation factor)
MVFKRKAKRRQKSKLNEQNKSNKSIMKAKNKNLKRLDHFIDEKIGKKGTQEREEFDVEYDAFKLGVLIQQAREDRGLTQEQLAESAGTNKSYISKLERDLKDIRFSTLQRIIHDGLGAELDISIQLTRKQAE